MTSFFEVLSSPHFPATDVTAITILTISYLQTGMPTNALCNRGDLTDVSSIFSLCRFPSKSASTPQETSRIYYRQPEQDAGRLDWQQLLDFCRDCFGSIYFLHRLTFSEGDFCRDVAANCETSFFRFCECSHINNNLLAAYFSSDRYPKHWNHDLRTWQIDQDFVAWSWTFSRVSCLISCATLFFHDVWASIAPFWQKARCQETPHFRAWLDRTLCQERLSIKVDV